MRVAIITDIHEDIEMLDKVQCLLKSKGYDMLVCLGDITGFSPKYYHHNPDANACIDFLREHATISLAGNHDLYTSQRLPSYHLQKQIPHNWYELKHEERLKLSNNSLWLYEEEVLPDLTYINESYLQKLKEYEVIEGENRRILFSHFIQPDILGIGQWFPVRLNHLKTHFDYMNDHQCSLSFVGHFHPKMISVASRLYWSTPISKSFRVKKNPRIVICPPVVRNREASGAVIFDTKTNRLALVGLSPP